MVAIATAQDKGFAARRSSRLTYLLAMLPPHPDSDRARLATGPFGPRPEHPDRALVRRSANQGPRSARLAKSCQPAQRHQHEQESNRAHSARQSRCSYPQDSASVVASTCPTTTCHGMRLRGAGRGRTFLTVDFCAQGKRTSRRELGFRGARSREGARSSSTGRLVSTAKAFI